MLIVHETIQKDTHADLRLPFVIEAIEEQLNTVLSLLHSSDEIHPLVSPL